MNSLSVFVILWPMYLMNMASVSRTWALSSMNQLFNAMSSQHSEHWLYLICKPRFIVVYDEQSLVNEDQDGDQLQPVHVCLSAAFQYRQRHVRMNVRLYWFADCIDGNWCGKLVHMNPPHSISSRNSLIFYRSSAPNLCY
jgi:hypothetical protein